MRKSRFTEEQIIGVLREAEAGTAAKDLCRRHGISRETFYRWKSKFGGMDVNEARRLKQLEEENRQLKHLVAELTLDVRALRGVLAKKSEARGATWTGRVHGRRVRKEPTKGLRAGGSVAINMSVSGSARRPGRASGEVA